MAVTRALLSRPVGDLHLVLVPSAGLQADVLIGAGKVALVEGAGVTLDEFGQAPCFGRAVRAGGIGLKDSTCPAVISALQAGEKGIPFIPIRGLLGSDIEKFRDDYQIIDNPFADGADPIVLLPAIVPDVALFHAPLADRAGNVWIGSCRELMLLAHAAKTTIISVEEIVDQDLLADPLRAPAVIPSLYVSHLAQVERGAWPLPLPGSYRLDADHLARYARAAATPEGFAEYLASIGGAARAAAE
jgi:glutaconate CoA-transferase subunit A